MIQAFLFTENPKLFESAASRSPMSCKILSLRQWNTLQESCPRLLMIDTSTLTGSQICPAEYPSCRPTVIFAESRVLLEILRHGLPGENRESLEEIPREISKVFDTALLEFHFSPSLKGYAYIKQAFYYQYLNARQLPAVKKDIYESVSHSYDTTVYSVERCITFAIRKAYGENTLRFETMFRQPNKPPSNMNFLKTFYIYLEQEGYL